ncbi:MAG: cell division FtsZ family protein [Fusobacteriaceae bacterium]|nr:cell division FtsZ family protein [Fusobacteriaceae bacterium]
MIYVIHNIFLLKGVDIVFIATGMGGSIGTGASPVVAEIAKELGILTIGVVTHPYIFEGKKRNNFADEGIVKLTKVVDSIIVIPNDKLLELPDEKVTLKTAFEVANKVMKIAIQGISDLILKPGLINLDLVDVTNVMKNFKLIMFGYGEAEGENRAKKAAKKALQSPFFNIRLLDKGKVLLNITADESLGLAEVREIQKMIATATGRESKDVQWYVFFDDTIGDNLQVILFANNFSNGNGSNGGKESAKQ